MEILKINKDNIDENNIDKHVIRCKALITNDENEILLGYCNHKYQFPGGHLEENETTEECLTREIKEETGISVLLDDIRPFYQMIKYCKNYPKEGLNSRYDILYYNIQINEPYDLEQTTYTEDEIKGEYELRYVKIEDVVNELISNSEKYPESETITKEMLTAFDYYFKENK